MNRPILIAALAAASAVTAFAATARTPAYIKYDGVDGSDSRSPVAVAVGDVNGDGADGRPARGLITPRKSGEGQDAAPRATPQRGVGAPSQTPRRMRAPSAQPQPDIVTGAGSGAAPGRDAKPPKPKPQGLLLPAIQKRH